MKAQKKAPELVDGPNKCDQDQSCAAMQTMLKRVPGGRFTAGLAENLVLSGDRVRGRIFYYRDAKTMACAINFCPWCGANLAASPSRTTGSGSP